MSKKISPKAFRLNYSVFWKTFINFNDYSYFVRNQLYIKEYILNFLKKKKIQVVSYFFSFNKKGLILYLNIIPIAFFYRYPILKLFFLIKGKITRLSNKLVTPFGFSFRKGFFKKVKKKKEIYKHLTPSYKQSKIEQLETQKGGLMSLRNLRVNKKSLSNFKLPINKIKVKFNKKNNKVIKNKPSSNKINIKLNKKNNKVINNKSSNNKIDIKLNSVLKKKFFNNFKGNLKFFIKNCFKFIEFKANLNIKIRKKINNLSKVQKNKYLKLKKTKILGKKNNVQKRFNNNFKGTNIHIRSLNKKNLNKNIIFKKFLENNSLYYKNFYFYFSIYFDFLKKNRNVKNFVFFKNQKIKFNLDSFNFKNNNLKKNDLFFYVISNILNESKYSGKGKVDLRRVFFSFKRNVKNNYDKLKKDFRFFPFLTSKYGTFDKNNIVDGNFYINEFKFNKSKEFYIFLFMFLYYINNFKFYSLGSKKLHFDLLPFLLNKSKLNFTNKVFFNSFSFLLKNFFFKRFKKEFKLLFLKKVVSKKYLNYSKVNKLFFFNFYRLSYLSLFKDKFHINGRFKNNFDNMIFLKKGVSLKKNNENKNKGISKINKGLLEGINKYNIRLFRKRYNINNLKKLKYIKFNNIDRFTLFNNAVSELNKLKKKGLFKGYLKDFNNSNKKKFFFQDFKKKKIFLKTLKLKLRFTWFFFKLKGIAFYLSYRIFKQLNYYILIFFISNYDSIINSNIFFNIFFKFFIPKRFRKIKHYWEVLFRLVIGFLLQDSNMIGLTIVELFELNKRHFRVLQFLNYILNSPIFITNFYSLKSLKITIFGKFEKQRRKRRIDIQLGKSLSFLTINNNIDYSFNTAHTYTGVFGIHVYLLKA